MSKYDLISKELFLLRIKTFGLILSISLLLNIIIFLIDSYVLINHIHIFASFLLLWFFISLPLHLLFRKTNSWYRSALNRIEKTKKEIEDIKKQINIIFNKYPIRRKGQRFKTVYNIIGKTLEEMEEILAVGMFNEGKEVFVTVFMQNNIAVKVTASIGSPYRCKASDNPNNWPTHIERYNCDEVRQYHNHPTKRNKTEPSNTDVMTTGKLQRILGKYSSKLNSIIIYWNKIGEWRVLEYDSTGNCELKHVFDVTA